MAANKFASMVHKNTNKLTLILVYAVLEWLLIILLLFNSLFSYLIIKFARYFSLKPPCLWCSRLDHIFEPHLSNNPTNLVCHHHAREISKLSYCLDHKKLVQGRYLCEDCFFSDPGNIDGVFGKEDQEEEMGSKCLCCGSSIERRELYSGSFVIKPSSSSDVHVDDRDCVVNVRKDDDDDQGMLDQYGEFQMVLSVESDQALKEVEKVKTEGVGFAWTWSESGQEKVDMEKKEEKQQQQQQQQDGDVKKGDYTDVAVVDNSSADQDQTIAQVDGEKKESCGEVLAHHLEFYIGNDECQLIPVDSIDYGVEESQGVYKIREGDGNCGFQDVILDFCSERRLRMVERAVLPSIEENEEEEEEEDRGGDVVEDVKVSSENSSYENKGGLVEEGYRQVALAQATKDLEKDNDVQENEEMNGQFTSADINSGDEECNSQDDEINTEVSIGTEIPEQETIDEIQMPEDSTSNEFHKEEQSTSYNNPFNDYNSISLQFVDDRENDGSAVEFRTILKERVDGAVNLESPSNMEHIETENERNLVEFKTVSVEASEGSENGLVHSSTECNETQDDREFVAVSIETSEEAENCQLALDTKSNETQEDGSTMELKAISVEKTEGTTSAQLPLNMEYNETEDEKIPDTPTSVDSLNQLHRKLLLLGRAESGTEESLDGSVISDIEGGEGTLTVEKLKSALRAERKALHALYAELEEERSASAVAASQTMAMINRLQEEKAAMQMEALQYQRMMEEQSEYDQEALQLLNDLMVKREKEKEELEKELEVYRRKVQEYGAKEKIMMLTRSKDGNMRRNSSASHSNAEDSDGSSVDFSHETKEEANLFDNQNGHSHGTPADAVLSLEEPLNDFEVERVSILEQLKALEEKLFTINGVDEQCFEDVKPTHDLFEHRGNGYEGHVDVNGIGNGILNGHAKINGTQHERGKLVASKAKRLLPLFNAVDADMEDGIEQVNGSEDDIDILQSDFVGLGDVKKLAIEEEVDHVYERLHALEADREFLKHCVSSLKKGDKGLILLQEILQHLRDLRSVELRVRDREEGILQ